MRTNVRNPSHLGSYAQLASSGTDVPEAASMGASFITVESGITLRQCLLAGFDRVALEPTVVFPAADYHIQ
jgi:hypothetical protein